MLFFCLFVLYYLINIKHACTYSYIIITIELTIRYTINMPKSIENTIEMMESVEEQKYIPSSVHTHTNPRWRSALIILFVIGVCLECANITLVSKCETHSDASQALRSMLSQMSEHKPSINDLIRPVKEYDYKEYDIRDLADQLSNNVTSRTERSTSHFCNPRREFVLHQSDKRVNVCTYRGRVRVDIRQFLGSRSTIKGIYFEEAEFLAFSEIFHRIQVEVNRQLLQTRI